MQLGVDGLSHLADTYIVEKVKSALGKNPTVFIEGNYLNSVSCYKGIVCQAC